MKKVLWKKYRGHPEEKENKKKQYGCKWYKNLSEDEKPKLV